MTQYNYDYNAPGPGGYAPQQSNGKATASLVLSILGLTLLPTLGSIIGLILGYMAKKEIDESGGMMGGADQARWGIILSWVGIGLTVLGCCIVSFFMVLGPMLGVLFSDY